MAPEPTRMYYNGPIRMFSQAPFLGGVPYHGGTLKGYAGNFVCGQCRFETQRVLFCTAARDWVCRDCDTAWRRAEAGHLVAKGQAS